MSQKDPERFFDSAASHTAYLAASVGGAKYLVRTEDTNVGKSLFVKGGRSEMLMLRRAVALVRATLGEDVLEGSEFLDVGANIGTTTVPALLDGPFGSAICFEPEPQNFIDLRMNLLLNGLDERASALAIAVSDQSGTAQFVADTRHSGQGWVATTAARLDRKGPDAAAISVATMTLDDLAESGVIDVDRVGMLWIDAQSHEGHILAGGHALLERGVPIVLEWYPRALDRLGDRGSLQEGVAEHYTHFIDLRAKPSSNGNEFEILEAAALSDYIEPFSGEGSRRYTDILILRLAEEVAKELDVTATLREATSAAAPKPRRRRVAAKARSRTTKPAKTADPEVDELRKAKRALREGAADGGEATLRERKQSAEAQALREAKRALREKTNGGAEATPKAPKQSAEAQALREAKRALRAKEAGPGKKRSAGPGDLVPPDKAGGKSA